jgi:Cu/Ag efflux pump CusA
MDDILVSLKPRSKHRPAEELIEDPCEKLKAEVPEPETGFVPLVQDQINGLADIESPIAAKVFGPDFAMLCALAEEVSEIVADIHGAVAVKVHVLLGDIIIQLGSV